MNDQSIHYAWEQLYGAVSSLATSDSSLRGRLLNAVVSRAQRVFMSKEELPKDISLKVNKLEEDLTRHGSFKDTIEKMSDNEVYETIEDIVSLFSHVARAFPET